MVEVLRRQKELGQTNQECAVSAGMSIGTIMRWRVRLRARLGSTCGTVPQRVPSAQTALVEWTPRGDSSGELLKIELPDGVRLTVPGLWSASRLAELVSALRSS
jgi:hypothetical protein